jgi:hypothetical protein
MGLTEVARLKLEDKGFNTLFDQHQAYWGAMAEQARAVMTERIPHGEPTVDDIKKILLPLVEIDPRLRAHITKTKTVQKYWIGDFTDYILHRVYNPQLGGAQ